MATFENVTTGIFVAGSLRNDSPPERGMIRTMKRVGSVLVLALLITISTAAFGTGTAGAQEVQVVNPATSPALTSSVDDPGRVAYESTISRSGHCRGFTLCEFSFPSVPAGHRVVVQHIAGILDVTAGVHDTEVQVITGEYASVFFEPVQTAVSGPMGAFERPILFYVDSSKSVGVIVAVTGGGTFSPSASALEQITLTGYELDCTVAACAPIATE